MSRRYQLSIRDQARFDALLAKECLDDPMLPEELAEYRALIAKRRSRLERDPKVKAELRAVRWRLAKTRRLMSRFKKSVHASQP